MMSDLGKVLNVNVAILGHVDSGKTALAKALSTVSSTASFDKSPESQERGITLDLGFSAFFIDVPPHLKHLDYDKVQITLVDCPGHASLIKTVIGGAHIMNLMLLVIDVTKGIQTQTAESLIIGEILTDNLIVVLNKTDQFPEAQRNAKVSKMCERLAKVFAPTRFHNASMVPLSALTGEGVPGLLTLLSSRLPSRPPQSGPVASDRFLFLADHCFSLKGKGTVVTGTVLQGEVTANQTVVVPALGVDARVKSLQMFHRPVTAACEGDRAGLCLAGLEAKKMNRGYLCAPGMVVKMQCAVMAVHPISYYKFPLHSGAKLHITVGHTTTLATVEYFSSPPSSPAPSPPSSSAPSSPSDLLSQFKSLMVAETPFDFNQDYLHVATLPRGSESTERYYALLKLDHPILVPLQSLAIAAKLDADIQSKHCRLAFHGAILARLESSDIRDLSKLRIYKPKERMGTVDRVAADHVIGKGAFGKDTDISLFCGLSVLFPGVNHPPAFVDSSFGRTGKFKIRFNGSAPVPALSPGTELRIIFKKYVYDGSRKMHA